jgi:LPXTG-motif cell wall-anchored protein
MHTALLGGLAIAFTAAASIAALAEPGKADPPGRPDPSGNAYGINGKPGAGTAVPGPVAGAGLPLLLAAGGYYYVRRRRQAARRSE